jgi:hypothetical protein
VSPGGRYKHVATAGHAARLVRLPRLPHTAEHCKPQGGVPRGETSRGQNAIPLTQRSACEAIPALLRGCYWPTGPTATSLASLAPCHRGGEEGGGSSPVATLTAVESLRFWGIIYAMGPTPRSRPEIVWTPNAQKGYLL